MDLNQLQVIIEYAQRLFNYTIFHQITYFVKQFIQPRHRIANANTIIHMHNIMIIRHFLSYIYQRHFFIYTQLLKYSYNTSSESNRQPKCKSRDIRMH